MTKSVLALKKYPYTMIEPKTSIMHQHKKSKFIFFIPLLLIYSVCLLVHAQMGNVYTFHIKMDTSNVIYVDASFIGEQIDNPTNIKWMPAKLENKQEIVIGSNIVLKLFAESTFEIIPSRCRFYRMGGDEFEILFPSASRSDTEILMQKIKEAVHSKGYSIAMGCGEYKKGMDLDDLIKEIDAMMYEDKARMKALQGL